MDRRQLLAGLGAMAATPALAQSDSPRWSAPVIDMHFHMRRDPAQNVAHQVGAGITAANLLTGAGAADQVAALRAQNAAMFPSWFASANLAAPEAAAQLTAAVKAGAKGFGELKLHLDADGAQMRRAYDVAAELNVPVLIHFQDATTDLNDAYNSGFRRFEAVLKAFPRTKFIGHANSFWAHVSANYADQAAYPEGPIVPGGLTDRLLADYPNLYGDLSANSAHNALTRTPAFTVDFLKRQQDKLHFGSDCNCEDGRGGGAGQNAASVAAAIRGKCVARETLSVLTKSTTPEIFRKLVWTNGHRLIGLAG
ncbi:MAG: amidohydrolase family protein [Alphaproteobacteria bacterium]|nr:amidohydrolase family protein [Alphaproteobacteria bacterium]